METIFVRTRFDGIHHFADAPAKVYYLRQSHRHIFKVEVEIEVKHNNRELEFYMVKDWLDKELRFMTRNKSCEQMCEYIQRKINEKYGGDRYVKIEVNEDGQNGARLYQLSERATQ